MVMKVGAAAAASSAVAAVLLIGLGGCGSGARHSANAAAAPRSSAPPIAGTPNAAASPSADGWTVIQPAASTAPAASQAASDLAAYPSASAYPMSSTQSVYSLADVGVSGSGEYVDAYSVTYVCGAGIADDCDRFAGTPEYRIPLAPGARFILLGPDTQPNQPVDFTEFQRYAAGTDGKYDGNYDLFVIAFTGDHQATSLTAVYTP